jgi:hypothetical protein
LQANKKSAPLAQDTEHSSEAKLDLQVVIACACGRLNHALAEYKPIHGLNKNIEAPIALINGIVNTELVFVLPSRGQLPRSTTLCVAADSFNCLQVAIQTEANLRPELESQFGSVAGQVQCDDCPRARLRNQKSVRQVLIRTMSGGDLEMFDIKWRGKTRAWREDQRATGLCQLTSRSGT